MANKLKEESMGEFKKLRDAVKGGKQVFLSEGDGGEIEFYAAVDDSEEVYLVYPSDPAGFELKPRMVLVEGSKRIEAPWNC